MSGNVKRKRMGGVLFFLLVIAILLSAFYYFISTYSITTVYVEGNVHYTQDEIREMVLAGPFSNNSLYLSMKYSNRGMENIPFVDVMDVSVLEPDTIRITVYEKALAGYIEYLDTYMYFDRDGYVVETSNIKTVGIPQITGLSFDHVVLGEKLPVTDDSVFEGIMQITNLLERFELIVDKIYFQKDKDIILYFGDIRVMLGAASNLEEKIMMLPTFLKDLEGQKGILHMENYIEGEGITVFEGIDKEKNP